MRHHARVKPDPVSEAALAALEDMDELLQKVAAAIREGVPEYAYVTDDRLYAAMQRNVTAIVRAWAGRRSLDDEELSGFEDTVEERARAGVRLDDYLHAVAVAEAAVWEHLWQRLPQGSAGRAVDAFARRIRTMNTITRVTASAHQRVELVTARESYERRALAIRSLLREGLTADQVREHAADLGLDHARSYYVVHARSAAGLDSDQVQAALSGRRIHPPYAAFAMSGDEVVGFVLERPGSAARELTVGISAAVPLADAHVASRAAALAFATAWALGLRGPVTVPELGLRAAVQQLPDMGQALREKYLHPLNASASLAPELIATLQAFLRAGSRKEAAAGALHIHKNTVAYRLSRFTELTGADLTDVQTVAELWWLLTDLELRPD